MVDISVISDAIQEAASSDEELLYHPVTQEINYSSEIEEEDENEWIALPSRYEINSYHAMELFIETIDKPSVQEWLSNSIHGKGAFRMFRATCERFGILQEWYDFQEQYYIDLAKQWCAENNIEYEAYEEPVKETEEEFDWNDESQFQPKEEEKPVVRKKVEDGIRIVQATDRNRETILWMVEEYLSEFPQEGIDDGEELLNFYEDQMISIYFASKQGRPVAFMAMDENIPGEVLTIYVRKDMRKKGIGTQLLQKAQEVDEDVQIYIEPDHEIAKKFLAANGYTTIKRIQMTKTK